MTDELPDGLVTFSTQPREVAAVEEAAAVFMVALVQSIKEQAAFAVTASGTPAPSLDEETYRLNALAFGVQVLTRQVYMANPALAPNALQMLGNGVGCTVHAMLKQGAACCEAHALDWFTTGVGEALDIWEAAPEAAATGDQ